MCFRPNRDSVRCGISRGSNQLSDPDRTDRTLGMAIFVSVQNTPKRLDSKALLSKASMISAGGAVSHVRLAARSTAPRVATNFRPALRQDLRTSRYALHTTSYLTTIPSRCIYTGRPVERRATYATMAAATSFYEFKPKDSMSSRSFYLLSLPYFLSPCRIAADSSPQRKAHPTTSASSTAKSSSSSTPRRNAASHPSLKAWRSCTRR
jgi:hypothetical protein